MLPTAVITQSIGKQLMAARTARGLSVEDIAFKTHIPAARISELENDDFSNFANLTYAKGFLKIYSNHLNLDLSDYLDQFNTSEFANISGHDYIQSNNTGLTSMSMAVAPDRHQGKSGGLFGIILILATLIGLPIYYWSRPKEPDPEPVKLGPPPKAKVIAEEPGIETPEPVAPVPAPENVTKPVPPVARPVPETSATSALTKPPIQVKSAVPIARRVVEDDEPAAPVETPPTVPTPTVPTPNP